MGFGGCELIAFVNWGNRKSLDFRYARHFLVFVEVQAIFLDRDGTVIEWVDYISEVGEVRLCEGIVGALEVLKRKGCRVFLHTNQSGVGRGYFGMEAVEEVNGRMFELLGVGEDFFDGICIATDDPSKGLAEGSYRKPSARFELEMAEKFGLDLSRCVMIGDSICDVETGLNAGMKPVGLWREGDGVEKKERFLEMGAEVHGEVADVVREIQNPKH